MRYPLVELLTAARLRCDDVAVRLRPWESLHICISRPSASLWRSSIWTPAGLPTSIVPALVCRCGPAAAAAGALDPTLDSYLRAVFGGLAALLAFYFCLWFIYPGGWAWGTSNWPAWWGCISPGWLEFAARGWVRRLPAGRAGWRSC